MPQMLTVGRGLNALLCFVSVLCASAVITSPARGFKTLIDFNDVDGAASFTPLVQGIDGDFYGTTSGGGAANEGAVFKITPAGNLAILYNFCTEAGCVDGAEPFGGLTQATDGNLYGTTRMGGVFNSGSIFKVTRLGQFVSLYSFCAQAGCPDGAYPYAALVQSVDGNLYGTTQGGGAGNVGTVFKITTSGTLTTLHSFGYTDGSPPQANLVQGLDGDFYGETAFGGSYGSYGTVFEINSNGKFKTLYSFCAESGCTDGANPYSGLVLGNDGNFYGTTSNGGAAIIYGTVFKITPHGQLTTLYSFCLQGYPCTDGSFPYAGLVQATDGNFYGATTNGGSNDYGTLFAITPNGAMTTLHEFLNTDGRYPFATLIQGTNGSFYGTTTQGGDLTCDNGSGCGTVFRLSTGLSPFVSFVQAGEKAGRTAEILGQGFTGATGVSFNGTPAIFTIKSDTFLTAMVPAGATTGYVTVTTPSGTLTSNVPFHVIPRQ
jgi:uncharacterized repeat protein (TIGR03803 family)